MLPTVAGPISAGLVVARSALLTIVVLSAATVLQLTLVSRFEHLASQHRLYDQFRSQLAQGTAPASEYDRSGKILAPGTPLALLDIPSIGVHEVVSEGTSGAVLEQGPGHLRGTPLPGEIGTSQIFGRAAAYGGPFGRIASLRPGSLITARTGVGPSTYRVIDVRSAGDPMPAPVRSGGGRLTLLTADGGAFVPDGVLRVDADLVGRASPDGQAPVTLSPEERALGTSAGTLWQLVLWLEALLLLAVGAVLSWRRWGRRQTWIAFLGPVLFVAYYLSDQLTRLLPNLM